MRGGDSMKAAVLYEINALLKVEDVELERPRAHEVRVRIAANGICRSDYSLMHGTLPSALPVVPGHEGAGIVEEVGPGVKVKAPIAELPSATAKLLDEIQRNLSSLAPRWTRKPASSTTTKRCAAGWKAKALADTGRSPLVRRPGLRNENPGRNQGRLPRNPPGPGNARPLHNLPQPR
jgi:Alcohol dehydrogenase GroES-like domain